MKQPLDMLLASTDSDFVKEEYYFVFSSTFHTVGELFNGRDYSDGEN